MEAVVRPPIFVLDREGWISVFDSVAATEAGLETIDVEADEYAALDAAGQPLRLTAVEAASSGRWFSRPAPTVRLDAGAGAARPELLRQVLIEALGGEPPPPDEALDALVTRALAGAGRDPRAARSVGEVRAAVGLG